MKTIITTGLILLSCKIYSSQDPCDSLRILKGNRSQKIYSPDSSLYFVNKQDKKGVYQIYMGKKNDSVLTCISIAGPAAKKRKWKQRNKMQVQWHVSGKFIVCAVEWDNYPELHYTPFKTRLGILECGVWMDIYTVTPDGKNWNLLAKTIRGFTGPSFTPDGKKCAWAEAQNDANMLKDRFGKWKLQMADLEVNNDMPVLKNIKDINPPGCNWIEPGNFSPDGISLLISADIGMTDARGQDQFILNINTGEVKNLNNSPEVWDEHGVFSPDGKKILFMSSYPYRSDPNSFRIIGIKTEFMLMNSDGSGLQQLTHFCEKGFLESGSGIAAIGYWSPDGSTIYCLTLMFPDYNYWVIKFKGNCGNSAQN